MEFLNHKLSDNFWLSEIIRSDTAVRYGINNLPTAEILEIITNVTLPGMERIRSRLGNHGVAPTSFYRCPELNAVVYGSMTLASLRDAFLHTLNPQIRPIIRHRMDNHRYGSSDSQHQKGEACDFTVPAFGSVRETCEAIEKEKDSIGYDQLIYEFGSWCHVAFSSNPRGMVLTIDREGARHGIHTIR